MSFPAVSGKVRPALAFKFTVRLGVVMLTVGFIFSTIYFVLSVSLFARLASQHLDQKAKSAEVIVRAVANSRETINSSTLMRNLQNGGFTGEIAVFTHDKLIAHSDEAISNALSKYAIDPKVRLKEVEGQNRLLRDVLAHRKGRGANPFFMLDDVNYIAFVHDNMTVLVGLTAQKPKLLTLAASFLLLCILAVGINVIFVYHYGYSLAQTISQIVRGLDVDSIHVDSIDPQYQEIEALMLGVDEKIRQSHIPAAAAPLAPIAQSSDGTAQLLQNKLFEKPFPRMQHFELAVYPRRPKPNTKEFISGAQNEGHTDVLIGVTDSDAIEALIAKHRVQERFLALGKENLTSAEIARNLWTALFAVSEFVPGLFFARLDEAAHNMDIFRAGSVHLFEIEQGGACNEIHLGSEQFGSEYTMISEYRLKENSHFVMVSQDAFSAMELSHSDFAALLGRMSGAKSGKLLLAGILEKIHQKLPAGETVPGLIAVLSEKK